MTLPLILMSLVLAQTPKTALWYGPSTAVFNAQAIGNPFDPEVNDVRVAFTAPDGHQEWRLAYWSHQAWRSVLVAHQRGVYTARLYRNGHPADATPIKVALDASLGDGFVRVGGPWGFHMDSGRIYWPMGHNLAWHSDGLPSLASTLHAMKGYGANWARIWACSWDGMNPWWKSGGTYGLATLDEDSLDQWQGVVSAAEEGGVRVQLVLFHHGEFTTYNDSNWSTNPWNAKNGGFLVDPADFFTNPQAIALTKAYLRYMVARFSYSPSIMGWELFNEVESVNAIHDHRITDVRNWHDSMTAFIRSIDPYHHLITSSSDLNLPIFGAVDYTQAHAYPSHLEPRILAEQVGEKPFFFGEVGISTSNVGRPDGERRAIRDAIWTSLFRHFAGSAQYWYWDAVFRLNLQDEWSTARRIIDDSHVLSESNLVFVEPDVQSGTPGDLVVQPSGDWVGFKRLEYNLPADAIALGAAPTYFQGAAHPEMRSGPLMLHMNLPVGGTVEIRVTNLSKAGGNLVASVNGGTPMTKAFPPGTDLKAASLAIAVPAGRVDLQLDNTGADWVGIGSISIPGLGRGVEALGIGNPHMALVRLERSSPDNHPATISGLGLIDGPYQAILTDLASGRASNFELKVERGAIRKPLLLPSSDAILSIWAKGVDR